jgi:hypothetical protein
MLKTRRLSVIVRIGFKNEYLVFKMLEVAKGTGTIGMRRPIGKNHGVAIYNPCNGIGQLRQKVRDRFTNAHLDRMIIQYFHT